MTHGRIKIDGADFDPFYAVVAADVVDTTPVAVKAAVAGKRHLITQAKAVNKTTAQLPVIVLQDDSGTPVIIGILSPGDGGVTTASPHGGDAMDYSPGRMVAAGKAINAKSLTAFGDTLVEVGGYVEV